MVEKYNFQINNLFLDDVLFDIQLIKILAVYLQVEDYNNLNWHKLINDVKNEQAELISIIIYGFKDLVQRNKNCADSLKKFMIRYNSLNDYNHRLVADDFTITKLGNDVITIDGVFNYKPIQFGFRGDPYLWTELKECLEGKLMPTNEIEFVRQLVDTIEDKIQTTLGSKNSVYVKRYNHGGMSSGRISITYWKNIAIPMLISRYRIINTGNA